MIESEHFKAVEMICKCGCGKDAPSAGIVSAAKYRDWLYKLEAIRSVYGKPMHINSAYRCENRNKKVGGVANSQHTVGLAVDIYTDTANDMFTLMQAALRAGVICIGVGKNFLHLDSRIDVHRLWGY